MATNIKTSDFVGFFIGVILQNAEQQETDVA